MIDFSLAVESLPPGDIALVCAAVLLLFGASSLSALRSQDRLIRSLARTGYLIALSAGVSVAVLISTLHVPERFASLFVVAAVLATLFARFRTRSQLGVVAPPLGDFGMTAVFLATFSAISALLAFAGSYAT